MLYVTAQCDCCRKQHPLAAPSINRGLKEIQRSWVLATLNVGKDIYQDNLFCESCALSLGLLVQCPGEAHTNPYIDNCSICIPRWGTVLADPQPAICWDDVVKVFSDIQAYRLANLVEEPDIDDATDRDGYGDLYPTEEAYLT